jgi:glycine/D-amino acid oxidase-like deaminating enzyme
MRINKSPWIQQLDHERKSISLNKDVDTDIAIIGAGIAGISTAFFVLKYTNQRVVMLEQGRLAHGATGHNAGQVVARFERPLVDIEKEFGFDKTSDAIRSLQSSWLLIDEMYADAGLDIIFSKTKGNIGFSNLYQVLRALGDLELEVRSGLQKNTFLISETAPFVDSIPRIYENLYKLVPQSEILKTMETKDEGFHALYSDDAACMNSALFSQEIALFLLKKYGDRFSLYEETRVNKIVLKENHGLLDAEKNTINASKIILCTNGFENFDIINHGGLAINKNFHHLVGGKVGYMSGYLENMDKSPTVIAYCTDEYDPADAESVYLYLTRRPHEYGDKKHNLVCIGGPEVDLDDKAEYMRNYDYPDEIPAKINQFLKEEYSVDPKVKIDYEFTWHGLMGYTPNRIRLIGEEPKNNVLLYNLGCNGIGIIPSIYGGRRISRIVSGENVKPSIFDPK